MLSRLPLSDAVVETLRAEGTDTVFGIGGGYFFSLLDAFRRAGIRNMPSRHEGAAAFAAAAYAQASGRIGVVFGQGPGATNTVTGVASAYCDSTPLLVLASQAPQNAYAADAQSEKRLVRTAGIEQLPLFRAVTRERFDRQRQQVPCAACGARSPSHAERGPVMLEIATNLFRQDVKREALEPAQYRAESQSVDLAGVGRAAELIARAENPVLVIGNRATHRGLSANLQELCELAKLPFATTDFAKGAIAEDHPLALGVVGLSGHPGPLSYLESSISCYTIGARLDSKTTLNYQRNLFKNVIQLDELASEIGRNFPLRLGVLGDIPATVRALRDAVRGMTIHRAAEDRAASSRHKFRT